MCLIVFAWQQCVNFDVVLAANRDEFHARPAAAAHWWADATGLFGGRDLQAGGAWCAAGRDGRFAAVTNVREPVMTPGRYSRGRLVRDYLAGAETTAASWAEQIDTAGADYSPFNLLIGDAGQLWFVSNRGHSRRRLLGPGIYAVSNGHWGEHWPKTDRAEHALRDLMARSQPDVDPLFNILADRQLPPGDALPNTGVDRAHEEFLSPIFIAGEQYGTRASTVLRRAVDGRMDYHERSFDSDARPTHRVDDQWFWNPDSGVS
ncbi:MAG: NRDE family protein [Salinisphaera sp.]|jgi:uncharacterized protein with NRDE domain|nr:NRDE family protein [Salinisphaera sp.]